MTLIPRHELFGSPERALPQLSPDGSRLAFLAPFHDVLNVFVGADVDSAVAITSESTRPIRWFTWAMDDRHLLYTQDVGGDENFHLFRVDSLTGDTTDLTPFDGVAVEPLGASHRHPDLFLFGMNLEDPEYQDAYTVNVATGELSRRTSGVSMLLGAAFDADLQIRGATRLRPDAGADLVVRDSDGSEWRTLVSLEPEDSTFGTQLIGVTPDDGILLLTAVGANAVRLIELDAHTGEIRRVLLEDPQFDAHEVQLSLDRSRAELVTLLRERAELVVLDPSLAEDVAYLEAQDLGEIRVTSRDRSDSTWIVSTKSDKSPQRFYRYERATGEYRLLFCTRPSLLAHDLQPMESFSFLARDGLEVHGYLTYPPGTRDGAHATVLWVHGGPWERDIWGFDPYAQLFANRGYLAVQINYRGSTGYGKAFLNAGDREWGAKMNDDLVDAIDWLVAQGICDPRRVAITGGSYGGYAALVGASFTPERFTCAVSVCGPSNLNTLVTSLPPYWGPMIAAFYRRVGDPRTEGEFLASRSPLTRAADIRIPMLIVQGANDPRVAQHESDQIVDALIRHGVTHQYMVFEDEGHGFAKPENALIFIAAMERFLAEHLGGMCESAVPTQQVTTTAPARI